ncbi:Carnitinyl-CoA dehydratase [invertebrate metagenome]|uniref:3-hydroxyisobutyryl-CoA hydrolase n=1 Tax=invertebrate metagenome TaxID=1711999 RepID=A0A2H9T8Q6_9ZZZZ
MENHAVLFDELRTESGHTIGRIQLNKNQTLNALTQLMVDQIYDQLLVWKNNPNITCVFLDSSVQKSFCSGGDVREITQSIRQGDTESPERFFTREYQLDYLIHIYTKPVICWGHGIVMGGGLGLMAGADFRVVTDISTLAMPETAIGFFPDVGASWFLGRLPRDIGLFIALTGARLNAGDAIYLGLANRFIEHSFKEDIIRDLQKADWSDSDAHTLIYQTLHHYEKVHSAGWLPYSHIRANRDQIAALMDKVSLTDTMEDFQQLDTGDAWLKQSVQNALSASPLSLALTGEHLKRSEKASLKDIFQSEVILANNCAHKGDFVEGVRTVLEDRSLMPKWQYQSVDQIPQSVLDEFFTPFGKEKTPIKLEF